MANGQHKPLKGTHAAFFSGWNPDQKKKAHARHRLQVRLILKSSDALHDLDIPRDLSLKKRQKMFAEHVYMEDSHLKMIKQFARKYRLNLDEVNADLGYVALSGTVAAMNKAFDVDLHHHQVEHHLSRETQYALGHEGEASLPEEMHAFVQGVTGLNRQPGTHQVPADPGMKPVCAAKGHTSEWFAKHYRFPKEYRGKDQHIGIISCGGGFTPDDFKVYFRKAGIRKPPVINFVALDGSENRAGLQPTSDYELYTDCLVAACAAPEATITVCNVENSIFGFADGIMYFTKQKSRMPQVISYSWGASEGNYSDADITAVNRKLQYAAQVHQISIFCSTGDFGATNSMNNTPDTKLAVQYPAGSPWVTSCGGTMFQLSSTGRVKKELGWNAIYLYNMAVHNASGGGFSRMHKRPDYQKPAVKGSYPKWTKSQRGVPDVSAHANISPDNICYWIRMQGMNWVTGGTSAAAPLWAALTVRLNQALNMRIGFFNPLLYAMGEAGAIKSIDEGNNCMPNNENGWDCMPGWDPCTGLGVPDGEVMLAWLKKNFTLTPLEKPKRRRKRTRK